MNNKEEQKQLRHIHTILDRMSTVAESYLGEQDLLKEDEAEYVNHVMFHVLGLLLSSYPLLHDLYMNKHEEDVKEFFNMFQDSVLEHLEMHKQEYHQAGPSRGQEPLGPDV